MSGKEKELQYINKLYGQILNVYAQLGYLIDKSAAVFNDSSARQIKSILLSINTIANEIGELKDKISIRRKIYFESGWDIGELENITKDFIREFNPLFAEVLRAQSRLESAVKQSGVKIS